jgi:hypothetical protein
MARSAIAWLETQPDAAKLLGALADPEPPPEPRSPRRREPEPSSHPFAELAEKAAALTERVDRMVVHDDRWKRLSEQGYLEEGLAEIARYAAHRGITDPIAAAAALEREMGHHPEPAVSNGGHRSFHTLDRAEHRANEAALEVLLSGDDEEWLARTIPGYRRSSW